MTERGAEAERVLIVHSEPETAASVAEIVRRASSGPVAVYEASSLADALQSTRRLDPGFVFVDCGGDFNGLLLAKEIRRADRRLIALYNPLVLGDGHGEFFREAARAGIGDFVPLPAAEAEVAAALAAALPGREVERSGGEGRLVTFLAATGGVGTTTLAVNTALALAEGGSFADGVVLCDAAVPFGGAASQLGLAPDRDLTDLVRDLETLDAPLTTLYEQEDTGLFFLASPVDPAAADSLAPEELSRVLIQLRNRFGLVVVDAPRGLDLLSLAALELSDAVFAVTRPVTPDVLATTRLLEVLSRLELGVEVGLVVNGYASFDGNLPHDLVAEQTGRAVEVVLPWDRAVVAAANRGAPMTLDQPKAHFSDAIGLLAEKVAAAVRREADD